MPASAPKLIIHALGAVQVRLNGHLISNAQWRQITARDILYLLLAHPDGLTKEQIGVNYWPDSTDSELKLRFKNAIYRLRHAVGKQVISFSDEIYRFNYALDYDYDVENFQNEIDTAQKSTDPEKKIAHYKAAVKLYKGPYLSGIDQEWISAKRQRYERAFLTAQIKLGGLFLDKGQFDPALKCCETVLEIDPCFEEAHRLTIQIYASTKNWTAAKRQYEKCRMTLQEELGAHPSAETRALFEKLIK